jgi:hypothetical protein
VGGVAYRSDNLRSGVPAVGEAVGQEDGAGDEAHKILLVAYQLMKDGTDYEELF